MMTFGSDDTRLYARLGAARAGDILADAMSLVLEDAAYYLAEATPVGVYGRAQSAWGDKKDVKRGVFGRVEGVLDPRTAAPYMHTLIYGTAVPHSAPAPREPLVQWFVKKLGYDERTATIRADALRFSMTRRPRKGNDFRKPVIARHRARWREMLRTALKKNL